MLAEFATALARADSWAALEKTLPDRLAYLFEFHRLDLARTAPSGHAYSLHTLFDPANRADPPLTAVPLHAGPAGFVMNKARPALFALGRDASDGEFLIDPSLERSEFRSLIAVPLIDSGEILGALLLASRDTDAYGRREILESSKIAALVAPALHRLTLLDEIRRSNAELTEFASLASHDLRAPIRRLVALADMLYKIIPEPDEATREAVDHICVSAQELDEMTTRILDYARVGQSTDGFTLLSLQHCATEAARCMEGEKAEGDELIIHIGDLPQVMGRESQLIRLFQNLFSNALKFRHPDRPPEVTVSCQREGVAWVVRVQDNGIGIEPEEAELAFSPFRRLHTSYYEGTGIGLSICRRIAQSHNGTIWIEATGKDRGTRVLLTLPDPKLPTLSEEGLTSPDEQS